MSAPPRPGADGGGTERFGLGDLAVVGPVTRRAAVREEGGPHGGVRM